MIQFVPECGLILGKIIKFQYKGHIRMKVDYRVTQGPSFPVKLDGFTIWIYDHFSKCAIVIFIGGLTLGRRETDLYQQESR
jgi:hypothetical protein